MAALRIGYLLAFAMAILACSALPADSAPQAASLQSQRPEEGDERFIYLPTQWEWYNPFAELFSYVANSGIFGDFASKKETVVQPVIIYKDRTEKFAEEDDEETEKYAYTYSKYD